MLSTLVTECGSPPAVANATVDASRGNFIYSVALYTCVEGYEPVENNLAQCGRNQEWGGVDTIECQGKSYTSKGVKVL